MGYPRPEVIIAFTPMLHFQRQLPQPRIVTSSSSAYNDAHHSTCLNKASIDFSPVVNGSTSISLLLQLIYTSSVSHHENVLSTMRSVIWQHRNHIIPVVRSRLPRIFHWPRHSSCTIYSQRGSPLRRAYSIDTDGAPLHEDVYIPEIDLEDFEGYTIGGYHPTNVGDTFHNGRYEFIHKLGFGGYSTIWLARDKHLERYVSLKILVANESSISTEATILQILCSSDSTHPGRRFIPLLLDEFSFDGPNGHHVCLVQEPAGCNIAASKEDSVNFMFPAESARSIAAQIIMGVSYLHSRGVCHGGMFKPV